MPSADQDATPKNFVLLIVEHGVPCALEWSCAYYINVYVQDVGEAEALGEALNGHDVSSGVWVAEVDLVDDGPSDWPGARECKLSASSCRRATEAEWLEHVRGEWVLPVRDSEASEANDELLDSTPVMALLPCGLPPGRPAPEGGYMRLVYPDGWPRCPSCGDPVLDGHITCGDARCNEAGHR
jgi:hypothetical protein